MRDHSTYLAPAGLDFFRCSKESMSVIPVAIGTTRHLWQEESPIFRKTSRASSLVRLAKIVEPMAFGWASERLPDLPIPWLKL